MQIHAREKVEDGYSGNVEPRKINSHDSHFSSILSIEGDTEIKNNNQTSWISDKNGRRRGKARKRERTDGRIKREEGEGREEERVI